MPTVKVSLIIAMLILALFFQQSSVTHCAETFQRVPNSTLRFPANPPVFGYTTENAFGNLSFVDPVALATPPGETNRLFVVQKTGQIMVITNLAVPNRTVFLDISSRILTAHEDGLLGLAFHPGYATNRQFFIFYSLSTTTAAGTGRHYRLARMETSPASPNLADTGTEIPLITQRDEDFWHNSGDLHFGPDGCLYISVGDEGSQYDWLNNSQRITKDLFSAIMRIDVDKRPGSLPPNPHPAVTANYAIPPDNPFVGATQFNGSAVSPSAVRTEFWAVGFRNPWRMSFDPVTGMLVCGDVGQDRFEEINIVVKGGNYGWNFRDASSFGFRVPPTGFTSINPALEYPHGYGPFQGNAAIGGIVYRGDRISQLTGAYVFADYVSGNIWSARLDPTSNSASSFQRLTGDGGIVAFGRDPRNGDILMADFNEDTIKRLVYSAQMTGEPLPPTLADTAAFTNLLSLAPNPGIIPYEINLPFWTDNAIKRRWFSLPQTNQHIAYSAEGNWSFPTGSVWIKHFELELTNGLPASRRRMETRFLMRNSSGVYGVTYRWDASQTNATLLAEEGMAEDVAIWDGGIQRTQVWRYPSRNQCLSCHNPAAGHVLGFNTAQLNKECDYGAIRENQIRALANAGYFNTPITNLHALKALAAPDDETVSLDFRVKSYLAANCAYCHQPGGGGGGSWDGRLSTPLSASALINYLTESGGSDPARRVVSTGNLDQSEMWHRLTTSGGNRMPPFGISITDPKAETLFSRWITNRLVGYRTFDQWQVFYFGAPTHPLAQPDADPDFDGMSNYDEWKAGTNPLSGADAWRLNAGFSNSLPVIRFTLPADRAFLVQWTTNLASPILWRYLDTPWNKPWFPSAMQEVILQDSSGLPHPVFYRLLLLEP